MSLPTPTPRSDERDIDISRTAGTTSGDTLDCARADTATRPLQPSPEPPPPEPHATRSAEGPAEGRRRLEAPVPEDEILEGLNRHDAEKAAELAEQLQRRLADADLVAELSRDGFTGPAWELFRDDLVRYANSVMGGWLQTGYIFALTKKRGFAQDPGPELLDQLALDADVRQEIATMTIAVALPRFREKALVGGGWDPEKGANVTTYFMGACVLAFLNEFRRHRLQQRRWGKSDDRQLHYDRQALYDPDRGPITDPGAIATGNERVREVLSRAKEREQAILAARLDGYSYAEIVELFDESSIRAIEGVVYRWRTHETAHLDAEKAAEHAAQQLTQDSRNSQRGATR